MAHNIRDYVVYLIVSLCAVIACSEDTVEPTPSPPVPVAVPCISYCNESTGDVWYAEKIDGIWNHTLVSYSNDVACKTALALDAEGNPHLSYHECSLDPVEIEIQVFLPPYPPSLVPGIHAEGYLTHAKRTGDGWSVETIEQTLDYEGFPCVIILLGTSLSLDVEGRPHIAYGRCDVEFSGHYYDSALNGRIQSDGYLKYAMEIGGDWKDDPIDQTYTVAQNFIFSCGFAPNAVNCHCISEVELMISESSLAFDTQGNPHVSYYDAMSGDLEYGAKVSGAWNFETIDAAGNVGRWASIAIDAQDTPHVAYYDVSNGDLKYAVRTNGAWEVEVVDYGGNVGRCTSLILDQRGDPHISYHDVSNGDLRYAGRIDGYWIIEVVDHCGDSEGGTSIAVDAEGNPHIAYYEASQGHLKYAVRTDGTWSIEPVDCWCTSGVYPSIVLCGE